MGENFTSFHPSVDYDLLLTFSMTPKFFDFCQQAYRLNGQPCQLLKGFYCDSSLVHLSCGFQGKGKEGFCKHAIVLAASSHIGNVL